MREYIAYFIATEAHTNIKRNHYHDYIKKKKLHFTSFESMFLNSTFLLFASDLIEGYYSEEVARYAKYSGYMRFQSYGA